MRFTICFIAVLVFITLNAVPWYGYAVMVAALLMAWQQDATAGDATITVEHDHSDGVPLRFFRKPKAEA